MNATFDRINEMRNEIIEIARKEAHRLFRIAREARKHGVSEKTVDEILDEAWYLYTTIDGAYPERLLEWGYAHNTKYAFR